MNAIKAWFTHCIRKPNHENVVRNIREKIQHTSISEEEYMKSVEAKFTLMALGFKKLTHSKKYHINHNIKQVLTSINSPYNIFSTRLPYPNIFINVSLHFNKKYQLIQVPQEAHRTCAGIIVTETNNEIHILTLIKYQNVRTYTADPRNEDLCLINYTTHQASSAATSLLKSRGILKIIQFVNSFLHFLYEPTVITIERRLKHQDWKKKWKKGKYVNPAAVEFIIKDGRLKRYINKLERNEPIHYTCSFPVMAHWRRFRAPPYMNEEWNARNKDGYIGKWIKRNGHRLFIPRVTFVKDCIKGEGLLKSKPYELRKIDRN